MNDFRTIKPNEPADFTPTLGNYKTLQPFRYWCQKVLPLVYDDSLTYYELLCKVVDYLNKTMSDVETLHGDVTNLHTAYVELQSYVNNYFSTLDVQEEIDNKLDELVNDGTLSKLLIPIIGSDSYPTFVDSVDKMTNTKLVYVLSTNGHIYYYNSVWVDSGLVYGSFGSYTPSNIVITPDNVSSISGDLNNTPLNKTIFLYGMTSSIMKNMPTDNIEFGALSTFQYNDNANEPGGYQLLVTSNDAYTRLNKGSSAQGFIWENWLSLSKTGYAPSDIIITPENVNSVFNDLNNAPLNKTVYLYDMTSSIMANMPTDKILNGVLSTFQYNDNANEPGGYQLLVTSNSAYTRLNRGSSEQGFIWENWVSLSKTGYAPSDIIITPENVNSLFNDLNNAPLNKTVYLYDMTSSIMANMPTDKILNGVLSTFQYSEAVNQPGGYQLLVTSNGVYTRLNRGSIAQGFIWENWNFSGKEKDYIRTFNLFRSFCTIGDSLSVGYHTLKNGTEINEDKEISWSSYIKNKYNNTVYWSGKSGATCKSWLNTTDNTWGINYLKSIPVQPLYILCMGANEVNMPIGSASDIGTNKDTLYAYISKLIQEVRKYAPNSFIISTGISRGQGIDSDVINVNNVYKDMENHFGNYYYADCLSDLNSEPFTSLYNNFHYTPLGYSALSELFEKKFNAIINNNISGFLYA